MAQDFAIKRLEGRRFQWDLEFHGYMESAFDSPLTRARIPRSHSCGIFFENRRPYFAPSPRHRSWKSRENRAPRERINCNHTTPMIVTWRECNAITFKIECEFEILEPHYSRPDSDVSRLFSWQQCSVINKSLRTVNTFNGPPKCTIQIHRSE